MFEKQDRDIHYYAKTESGFAAKSGGSLSSTRGLQPPLTYLMGPADIRRPSFDLEGKNDADGGGGRTSFNVILFCHGVYGTEPKRRFLKRLLAILPEGRANSIVVVFHCQGTAHFDDLVCQQTASFPTGMTFAANDNDILYFF